MQGLRSAVPLYPIAGRQGPANSLWTLPCWEGQRRVLVRGGAFTHFLLWVGGEKLALVTRSRLGLQLLTQQGITVAVNLYRHRTQQ